MSNIDPGPWPASERTRPVRIAAFMKYGDLAASTRQRLQQYEPLLNANGIEVAYFPLLDNAHLRNIARGVRTGPVSVMLSYARRIGQLLSARKFDLIWVHYELFPYLPGVVERFAAMAGQPVIYDYDDAIFHMYDQARNPLVRRLLGKKLAPLMKKAAVCLCGNEYLYRYASRYCDRALILPTVVDTDSYRPRRTSAGAGPPVVGWIGSPSTWAYVRPTLGILRELAATGRARVRIVGAGPIAETDRFPGLELVEWSEETEIDEVLQMDIGIMPLPDEPWARGKCGYKLIQYMACGLPVIASPVGVNERIVVPEENGLLARDDQEWREALERLLGDAALRVRFGDAGRCKAVEEYSLAAQGPRLLEAIGEAMAGGRAGHPDPQLRERGHR